MIKIKQLALSAMLVSVCTNVAFARLPAPNDADKAKAAEAANKSAHTGKVDSFLLCKSMNRVAEKYAAQAKAAGKTLVPTSTPECADPGPYVTLADAAAKAAATPAAAPAAQVVVATPAVGSVAKKP